MEKYRIAVIGAGVVGLSSAVCVLDLLPNAEVTLIADKFNRDTLSDGAGGLFASPITMHPEKERVLKWNDDSLKHFLEVEATFPFKKTGVRIMTCYKLYTVKPSKLAEYFPLKNFGPHYDMTPDELKAFPSKYKYGIRLTSVAADCRYYLPWLMEQFKESGGKVRMQHINCLSEISDDFDLIVNCTGLGARELLNDPYLVPIRGQTIRVSAPWIKNTYYGDNVYIIPGVDRVTLGGIKDYGSWSTQVNVYQKQYIWDECIKLLPSLEKAEVLDDFVGLRPHRSPLCLNSGVVQIKGKLIKLVNNYGHGASGVTLSWSTAKEAATLAKEILESKMFVAKL